MNRVGLALACATGVFMMNAAVAGVSYEIVPFGSLKSWSQDDHQAALDVFTTTCDTLSHPEWQKTCEISKTDPSAREFFERYFRPVLIGGGKKALFTGYYEPELNGSRRRGGPYQYPIYAKPDELKPGNRWHSRADIENNGLLSGRGLEIAYLDDPVEAFFLQIQGSGRIKLAEGGAIRVGFAAKNGHKYRSVGRELVRRGIYKSHQVSASVIRNWVKRNPQAGRELLFHNPSYVFFREVSHVPSDEGPLGAMDRSVSTLRSIAVDRKYTPLGAPVWIEKEGETSMHRLMVAQDTGSAIKGAQRADIFFGTGADAGKQAGQISDPGRMMVLLPVQIAQKLAPGG